MVVKKQKCDTIESLKIIPFHLCKQSSSNEDLKNQKDWAV